MKKILFTFSILLATLFIHAQTNLDSLWNIWNNQSQPDTSRLKAIKAIAWDGYLFRQPDSAYYFAQMQYDLAEKSGLKKQMADALNTQGISLYLRGEYPEAMYKYKLSLTIKEEIGEKKGIASSLNNIGLIYNIHDENSKALDFYQRSLKIHQEIDDKKGIANNLNNIAIIYQGQANYTKALEYFQSSLKIKEEIGNKKGIPSTLSGIGAVYNYLGDHTLAFEYYERSLKSLEEFGSKKEIASTLNNMGNLFYDQGDMPKALDYYLKALNLSEEIGDKSGIIIGLINIGGLNHEQGDYQKAINKCGKSLLMANEIKSIKHQMTSCQCLYNAYKAIGNGNKALEYHEQILVLDDSLNADETSKKLMQMEFNKKILADSLARVEEVRIAQQQEEEMLEAKNRKNQIQYSLVALVVFILAALLVSMTKLNFNPKVAASLIFIFFILIFEFMLVVLDPWVESITNGEVGFKILLNSVMALLIFGIHQISEKRLKKLLIKKSENTKEG